MLTLTMLFINSNHRIKVKTSILSVKASNIYRISIFYIMQVPVHFLYNVPHGTWGNKSYEVLWGHPGRPLLFSNNNTANTTIFEIVWTKPCNHHVKLRLSNSKYSGLILIYLPGCAGEINTLGLGSGYINQMSCGPSTDLKTVYCQRSIEWNKSNGFLLDGFGSEVQLVCLIDGISYNRSSYVPDNPVLF